MRNTGHASQLDDLPGDEWEILLKAQECKVGSRLRRSIISLHGAVGGGGVDTFVKGPVPD
jgi:hypothetical protein